MNLREKIEEVIVRGDSKEGTYAVEASKLAQDLASLFKQWALEMVGEDAELLESDIKIPILKFHVDSTNSTKQSIRERINKEL